MRYLWFVVDILCLPVYLPICCLSYLVSRVEAKPCPKCGEKWYTELVGEWDGEQWKCRTCSHYWNMPAM